MKQRADPRVKRVLDKAATLIKNGEVARGEAGLNRVLDRDPDNMLALLWKTKCTQDPAELESLFQRVLEIDPENRHALAGLEQLGLSPSRAAAIEDEAAQMTPEMNSLPPSPDADEFKQCPYCAEAIRSAAIVCRYCGRELDGSGGAPPPRNRKSTKSSGSNNNVPLLLGLLGLVIVCSMCALPIMGLFEDSSGPEPSSMAYTMSKQFVRERLKSPTTADFASSSDSTITDLGSNRWQVQSYVDSENSFGAMIRTHYTIILRDRGDAWVMQSLVTDP